MIDIASKQSRASKLLTRLVAAGVLASAPVLAQEQSKQAKPAIIPEIKQVMQTNPESPLIIGVDIGLVIGGFVLLGQTKQAKKFYRIVGDAVYDIRDRLGMEPHWNGSMFNHHMSAKLNEDIPKKKLPLRLKF